MGTERKNDQPIASLTRFRLGPREAMFALGVAAAVFGLWMIQFESLNVFSLTVVVVFFLMGIPLQQSWAIYLLIGTIVGLKFVVAPPASVTFVSINDLLFAFVAICFAAICFRFLELFKYVTAFYPSVGKPQPGERKTGYQFPSLLGGRWWLIPCAVLVATILLSAMPFDANLTRRYWITPTGARLIFLTFFLFFIWFVSRSIVSFAIRWRMEPEQADVQIRSTIADEFWNDQIPLESRRLKFRIRRNQT